MKDIGENMNDELIKNMSMTCNHAKETRKNYRVALQKYCAYSQHHSY